MIKFDHHRRVPKMWGDLFILNKIGDYTVSLNIYKTGQHGALQKHEQKYECHYVLEGTGRVWEGKENYFTLHATDLSPGMCIEIEPGTVHKIQAFSELKIIELSYTPIPNDRVNCEEEFRNSIG